MKLTVVLLDTFRTRIALIYENNYLPYSRRTVQIELTQEQQEALKPRKIGIENGQEVFEEISDSWLEE